jgi:multisubunit Na+/H+ antiporter MnhC subunit
MTSVGLNHYLVVSAILLVIGVFGIFLNRKNIIIILMAIELILLAVNLNLVAFSAALDDGDVRADGRRGGGCDRVGDRSRLFPQPRIDPG